MPVAPSSLFSCTLLHLPALSLCLSVSRLSPALLRVDRKKKKMVRRSGPQKKAVCPRSTVHSSPHRPGNFFVTSFRATHNPLRMAKSGKGNHAIEKSTKSSAAAGGAAACDRSSGLVCSRRRSSRYNVVCAWSFGAQMIAPPQRKGRALLDTALSSSRASVFLSLSLEKVSLNHQKETAYYILHQGSRMKEQPNPGGSCLWACVLRAEESHQSEGRLQPSDVRQNKGAASCESGLQTKLAALFLQLSYFCLPLFA